MKKRFLLSTIGAAAILTFAVAYVNAQNEGRGMGASATPIPQLPFHLVEGFFHYPANSIVGRVSGIAVGPK